MRNKIYIFILLILLFNCSKSNDLFFERKLVHTDNLKVLILGNSITGAPDFDKDWTAGWGISSSTPQKDYVHLLYEQFQNHLGYSPYFKTVALFEFEHKFDTYNFDNLNFIDSIKPDIIVVRFGDNVKETDAVKKHYWEYFDGLLDYISNQDNPVIVCTSCWYPNKSINAMIRSTCAKRKISYVDISSLYDDFENHADSERPQTSPGYGSHPGDRGMEKIATLIWNVLVQQL